MGGFEFVFMYFCELIDEWDFGFVGGFEFVFVYIVFLICVLVLLKCCYSCICGI